MRSVSMLVVVFALIIVSGCATSWEVRDDIQYSHYTHSAPIVKDLTMKEQEDGRLRVSFTFDTLGIPERIELKQGRCAHVPDSRDEIVAFEPKYASMEEAPRVFEAELLVDQGTDGVPACVSVWTKNLHGSWSGELLTLWIAGNKVLLEEQDKPVYVRRGRGRWLAMHPMLIDEVIPGRHMHVENRMILESKRRVKRSGGYHRSHPSHSLSVPTGAMGSGGR